MDATQLPFADDNPPFDIKLFLGQLPRAFNEENVRELFEKFGPIRSIKLLTNNQTGESKGCGFLTFVKYTDSVKAINELHDKTTLPGMNRTLQVKFVDETIVDPRLFIAQLPRAYTEDDLRQLFSQYGTVVDANVLKNPGGESKGVGFIKYANKWEGVAAIDALNEKIVLPGAVKQIQVRFAETQRDKEKKKKEMEKAAPYGGMPSFPGSIPMMPGMQPQVTPPGFPVAGTGYSQTGYPSQYGYSGMPSMQYGQPQGYPGGAPGGRGKSSGPTGCNLFIFNIPEKFTEQDMIATFAPFGNVLSASVLFDKVTNKPKNCGFVSFDRPESAQMAIQRMNGFMLGDKKLKVSLKTEKPRPF